MPKEQWGYKNRKKNTADSGKGVEKKGEGLGTGGVGANASGAKPKTNNKGYDRAEKKDTYKPSAETVRRVGEVFQEGAKWLGKAYNDPVGTIKSGVKAAGNAVNDLAKTARKNGFGPKTDANIKERTSSGGSSFSRIESKKTGDQKTKSTKKSQKTEKTQKQTASQVKSGLYDGKKKTQADYMREKRAAAEAQGKGKFNATEAMKQRRAAAEAQGKGKWNAQEEMRKRREAAARRKIQKGFNGKGK